MSTKNTIAVLLLLLPIILSGCDGEETGLPEDEQISQEEVEEILAEAPADRAGVRGSCNVIADKSTCIDYVGSLWTDEQIELNCQGVGVWSKNTCPYSEIGGCQVGAGTIAETIAWSYTTGGQPMPLEAVQYAAGACNATAMAKWVLPDDLLGQ